MHFFNWAIFQLIINLRKGGTSRDVGLPLQEAFQNAPEEEKRIPLQRKDINLIAVEGDSRRICTSEGKGGYDASGLPVYGVYHRPLDKGRGDGFHWRRD